MATFQYQAFDAEGKSVSGDIEAESAGQAIVAIEARGLRVQSIGVATAAAPTIGSAFSAALPGGEQTAALKVEREVLQSHMATLFERGRPLLPALAAYAEELPSGRQRRRLLAVCRTLENGDQDAAAAALAEMPEYWIPLLGAATSSSDSGRVLDEFFSESQRTVELRQQWWLTLAYPVVLILLTGFVLVGLSMFVIPEFAKLFAEFDLNIPVFTRVILTTASWLASWEGLVVALLSFGFIALLLNLDRILPARLAGLGSLLRPPFGRRIAIARFARFTADLLEAGVTVPDALRIAGFAVRKAPMQQSAWQLANNLESIAAEAPLRPSRWLTATVTHALTANLPTSSRVRLLREVSANHADRVNSALSWTFGIIEPIGICLVGFAVAMVVLALFSPLVMLIEGLSG
jgi:type II secretory pathway component PulF